MPAVRQHHPRRRGAGLSHQRVRDGIVESDAFRMARLPASQRTDHDDRCSQGAPVTMFISRRHLSRRTVLKGIGATIALPFLDAMLPAGVARRAGPQADAPDRDGDGARRRRQHRLRHQEEHVVAGRDGIGVRSGPDQPELARAVPRLPDHRQQHRRPQRRSVRRVGDRRRSLPLGRGVPDAVEAEADAGLGRLRRHLVRSDLRAEVRRATPIPSMQLCIENVDQAGGCSYNYSCVYTDTISWASPTDPLPMIRDPRAVFDQLFGVGATPEARRARRRDDQSILDWVTESVGDLRRARAGRSGAARGLPRRRPRDRAAHPEGRAVEPERRAARAAGRAGRRARLVRRARQADVRSAGGGVRRRHDPHLLVQAGPRRVEPRVRGRAARRRRSTPRRTTSIATIASPTSRRSTPTTSAWCRTCWTS